MKDYKNNLFYRGNIRSIEDFKKDVINYSYNITLEQKYKHKDSYRETSELTLEETLNLIETKDDAKIIHVFPNFDEVERFQVVFMKNWYFAWCDINLKYKDYFIKKYELKSMN